MLQADPRVAASLGFAQKAGKVAASEAVALLDVLD